MAVLCLLLRAQFCKGLPDFRKIKQRIITKAMGATRLFEDHAFVVVRMIDDVTSHRYEQIAVFFGKNFVVTFQEREGDPFNPVRKRIESSLGPR